MGVFKSIIIGIYCIVCVATIILATTQTKEGASETIVGGGSSNFYEKNKGKTREGKLKKLTVILSSVFVLLAIGVGIIYMV